MDEQLRQNDFSSVDFSFVYDLDEDSLNIFFDITDLAIESMLELIKDAGNQYIAGLTPDQAIEIVRYFYTLLDLYTDFELYEECEDILAIINPIEEYFENKKSEEIVGNVNEKH